MENPTETNLTAKCICKIECVLVAQVPKDGSISQNISEINPEDPDCVCQLKNIIKEHQILLRLVKKIDGIFSPSVLLSLMSSSFILCFTTFRLLNEKSLLLVSLSILILGFEMKEVVIICYIGNLLMDNSSKMFDALCTQNWLRSSLEYKKMVLLMLMVTRRPVTLNISGIAEVNLVTLKQVRK
ncbi:odorant receptor 85f-like [Teleopsis dalmanni]|uniref:odorant receptor 85f-like n=1 Tax=Teleopsis dalmanni TaxID=139649 RepID=UPI0018CD4799|nr:odorant receptor 85f-like [Teleopsis dalmanni]